MPRKLSQAEKDFIEQRGLMSEEDGQPRIMGRIWGLVLVVDDPLTAAQMAELLQVSRGSISTNIKLLSMLGVIEKSTRPGEREAYYCIAEHPYHSLISAMIGNYAKNCAMVEKAAIAINSKGATRKLDDLATFYRLLEGTCRGMLEKMK